jgi:zinc protease
MNQVRRLLSLLMLLVLSVSAHAQPLPTDPRLVTGQLDNGLRYIVVRHSNPPGRAAVWLQVPTGSLNETDQQRGLAHFLEHMAFNGSEHFPPGSVIPLFESLGMTFGQDQNAHTSFDQTVYVLSLPDVKPETLDKAMTFLSDVSMRLTFPPKEVDSERQVIQEERRTRLGGQQRIQDYYFEHLAPGSILGQRIPIGTEEAINSFKPQDFRDYYSKWYVPAGMTVLAVADAEPSVIVDQIKQHFSGGARAQAPKGQEIGLKPYQKNRAIIATDAEMKSAEVGFNWILPAAPPVTTNETFKARMVEQMGAWILNRRIQQRISEGKASFQSAAAQVTDLFGAARLAAIVAHGDPAKWKQMLADIATELQRARLHGFTEQELADAKKELQAGAERAVEVDATRPAQQILAELSSAVEDGDTITSAQQDLEVTRAILPQITLEQIASRFNESFDATRPLTFVLELPAGPDVPTEDALVELGVKALSVQPEAEAPRVRPTAFLDKIPDPSAISELAEDAAAHVWSANLPNGLRVHYRFMDYRKDQVGIIIALAGGEIQETAENRGITVAGSIAWSRPATEKLTSTDVRELLTGKKTAVGPRVSADTVMLQVAGSPEEIETGMQLASLLLAEPVVEDAAFDRWKDEQKRSIAQRKLSIDGVMGELVAQTMYPNEPRLRLLEAADVDRLNGPAAQAWLRKLCATAPIEVAVVGDIEKDKALDLVRRYLGHLRRRAPISHDLFKDLRGVRYPPGPIEGSRSLETKTDKAIALAGFYGASFDNIVDVRLLNVATRILSTRAIEDIREKRQLAYSPAVNSIPGTEYPYLGMVQASSPTAPDKVKDLIAAFQELYAAFAKDGPTAQEMDVAKKQIKNDLDRQMLEPAFWLTMLGTLEYRGRTITSILNAPEAYQAFTAEQVKAAWNKYDKPDATFRMWVTPAAPAAPAPATGATSTTGPVPSTGK